MGKITDHMVDQTAFTFREWRNQESYAYKILDLFGTGLEMIEQSTERLGEWREIDNASGRFLDMIGAQHGLPRPTNSDDFYRFLIKSRIEMIIRVGTINDLIQVLSNTSGLPTSSFNVENGKTPLSIKVLDMPTALTPNQEQRNILITWIKSVLPAGVSLEEMSFREASESEIKLGLVIEQATAFATPVTMVNLGNQEEELWPN